MIYLLAALVLTAYGVLLYGRYREERDIKRLVVGIGLVAMALFFTGFSRTMLVYKPILIAHIALTILCWYGITRYVLYRIFNPWQIFSPLLTIAFFFFIAWFFKES